MVSGPIRKRLAAFLRIFDHEESSQSRSSGHEDYTSATNSPPPVAQNVIVNGLASQPSRYEDPEVGGGGLSPIALSSDDSSFQATGNHTGESSNWFPGSSNFVLQSCNMVDTLNTITVNIQVSDKRRKAVKLLSKHIIPGSAHDSEARDPPPRCHPGTRININKRLITWFLDSEKRELIIWLYGPAGVGKSAIVQTFAETLASSNCLGASVFVSRNKQNDSQHVFITIAYQLAVRIEAYCAFIAEKLALDPQLVNKGMKEQFKTFIIEPFVEKKIGAGEKTWGVLLDGLDELDGQSRQRDIISLITTFVMDHPEVPLAWVISSRPEPHMFVMFNEQPTCLKESILIDSLEACQDVKLYLEASFKKIRNDFPFTVPKDWPSETAVLKLAGAASGLFVFASVAVRFIGGSERTDPVTRLDRILSVVGGLKVASPQDQPFAYLDALYTRILASIPHTMWSTTKQVLSAVLYIKRSDLRIHWERQCLNTLKGVSAISGIDPRMVYVSLNDCYSVIRIPVPENAYSEPVAFYHISFSDYLTDSTRSNEFHISIEGAEEDILQSLVLIWQHFKRSLPPCPDSDYFARWREHCSQYHPRENSSEKLDIMIDDFDRRLFHYAHKALFDLLVRKFALQQDLESSLDLLSQLDATTVCQGFRDHQPQLVLWLIDIWRKFPEQLIERNLLREVQFKELRFDQLYWPKTYPTHTWCDRAQKLHESGSYLMVEPGSLEECREYISVLKDFQRRCGTLPALICGNGPGKRFALLKYEYAQDELKIHSHCPLPHNPYVSGCCGYYTIPCSDDCESLWKTKTAPLSLPQVRRAIQTLKDPTRQPEKISQGTSSADGSEKQVRKRSGEKESREGERKELEKLAGHSSGFHEVMLSLNPDDNDNNSVGLFAFPPSLFPGFSTPFFRLQNPDPNASFSRYRLQ